MGLGHHHVRLALLQWSGLQREHGFALLPLPLQGRPSRPQRQRLDFCSLATMAALLPGHHSRPHHRTRALEPQQSSRPSHVETIRDLVRQRRFNSHAGVRRINSANLWGDPCVERSTEAIHFLGERGFLFLMVAFPRL